MASILTPPTPFHIVLIRFCNITPLPIYIVLMGAWLASLVDCSTLTPPTPVDCSRLTPPILVHTGGWSDLPCHYWAHQSCIWGCGVFGLPYLHRGVPGLPHRIRNPLLLQDTLWTSESVASLYATGNSSLERIILVSDNISPVKILPKGN